MQRPVERFLDQLSPTWPPRKNHDINLGSREELSGLVVKEEHAHVPGLHELIGPLHDVHLPTQVQQRQLTGILVKLAANLFQVRLNQAGPQIVYIGLATLTIIERHGRSQPQQLSLIRTVRLHFDCAGVASNERAVVFRLGGDVARSLIGTVLSPRTPEHNQMLAFKLFEAQDREVGRLDLVAKR